MNISSLLRVLWRRRLVVIPMAVLSFGLCVGTVIVAPPTYRSSASVVLLNPPALPVTTPQNPQIPTAAQNPYARFGDLSVIVDILVRRVDSESVKSSMKAAGLDGTFQVAANRDFYRGPIIDISAQSRTAAKAVDGANIVIAELQKQLKALQENEGTEPAYFINAKLVVGAGRATTIFSPTLRLLLLVAGVGLILTIGAGLLSDARGRRREKAPVDLDEAYRELVGSSGVLEERWPTPSDIT
jgi:capsular polysaccharide biosynthesis protein